MPTMANPETRPAVRPTTLRRSWLFVSGSDTAAQQLALASGADVLVADLEEFTRPQDRPAARITITALLQHCRSQRVVGAVRVNKLDGDGLADLRGIMPGTPVAVLLPHVETPQHLRDLDAQISALESEFGLPPGSTEIVPTIESARGIVALPAILAASPRISACLLAAEDLSNDLGAVRAADSIELQQVRARFLVDCIAAGCVPIDLPFSYREDAAVLADLTWAMRIGMKSKCVVSPAQVAAVHQVFTPSAEAVSSAADSVRRWESTGGQPQLLVPPVYPSDYNNARRLLARHAAFQAWDGSC